MNKFTGPGRIVGRLPMMGIGSCRIILKHFPATIARTARGRDLLHCMHHGGRAREPSVPKLRQTSDTMRREPVSREETRAENMKRHRDGGNASPSLFSAARPAGTRSPPPAVRHVSPSPRAPTAHSLVRYVRGNIVCAPLLDQRCGSALGRCAPAIGISKEDIGVRR
jgi:hypothetical protein